MFDFVIWGIIGAVVAAASACVIWRYRSEFFVAAGIPLAMMYGAWVIIYALDGLKAVCAYVFGLFIPAILIFGFALFRHMARRKNAI